MPEDRSPKSPRSSADGNSSGNPIPTVPEHTLLRVIGEGSYGQVWLAQNIVTQAYRAVKIIQRKTQDEGKAFDREYKGILNYEPISRLHPSLMDILQVGRNDAQGYFYYIMELADDGEVQSAECRVQNEINAECKAQSAEYSTLSTLHSTLGTGEMGAECGMRNEKDRRQRAEVRGQRAGVREQKAEGEQMTNDQCSMTNGEKNRHSSFVIRHFTSPISNLKSFVLRSPHPQARATAVRSAFV